MNGLGNMPLVSVVIPCFNSLTTLGVCLDSVINQSYTNIEVLVIDDGSTDGTRELIKKYESKDARIRVIFCEHQGVSVARNRGIRYAAGSYIQFVDSDDYLERDCTGQLVKSMTSTEADWIICNYYQVDTKNQQSDMEHVCLKQGIYEKRRFLKELSKHPGAHYYGVLWNKLYKSNIIQENKIKFPIDVNMGEDFIFNMSYLSYVHKIVCLKKQLYVYRWEQPGSLSSVNRTETERINERLHMYQAYEQMFERERIEKAWKGRIQYYIVKFYFDELEYLEKDASKYKKQLYEKCIRGTGISKIKFGVYWMLKRGKNRLKIKDN